MPQSFAHYATELATACTLTNYRGSTLACIKLAFEAELPKADKNTSLNLD